MSDAFNDAGKLRQELGDLWPRVKAAEDEVVCLRAERDALAKDAARYRWLREHVVATGLALWMGQHQTLSEAVDAARVAPTVEPKP